MASADIEASSIHMRPEHKAEFDDLLPDGMARGEFALQAAQAYHDMSQGETDAEAIAEAVADRLNTFDRVDVETWVREAVRSAVQDM